MRRLPAQLSLYPLEEAVSGLGLGGLSDYEVGPSETEAEAVRRATLKARASSRYYFRKIRSDGVDIIDYLAYAYVKRYQWTWISWGEMGSGKTTLMGWLLLYVYGDEDEALKYIVYGADNFNDIKAEFSKKGGRLPLVVIDDAAMQLFSRNHSVSEQRLFMQRYQTVREYCSTVIFCAPNSREIDASIRKKTNGIITVISPLERESIFEKYLTPRQRSELSRLVDRRTLSEDERQLFMAWFCLIRNYVNPQDPTTTIPKKRIIHGPDPLSSILYPPLPKEFKEAIDRKKRMATEIIDAKSYLVVREPAMYRRFREMLSRGEKAVLDALVKASEADSLGYVDSSDVKQYLSHYTLHQIELSLKNLAALGLALNDGPLWKPSEKGLNFVALMREREGEGSELTAT